MFLSYVRQPVGTANQSSSSLASARGRPLPVAPLYKDLLGIMGNWSWEPLGGLLGCLGGLFGMSWALVGSFGLSEGPHWPPARFRLPTFGCLGGLLGCLGGSLLPTSKQKSTRSRHAVDTRPIFDDFWFEFASKSIKFPDWNMPAASFWLEFASKSIKFPD